MDPRTLRWANDLRDVFDVSKTILTEILPSSDAFGQTQCLSELPDGLPVAGVAGDQHASLVGQGCLASSSSRPNSRSSPLGAIPPGGRPPSDAGDTPSGPSSMTIAPSPDPSRGSADSPEPSPQGRRSCRTSAMPQIGARNEQIATPHRKTSEEATPLQQHWRNREFHGVENNQHPNTHGPVPVNR